MDQYLPRRAETAVRVLLRQFPVVVITGPRQSGKSTLARITLESVPDSILLDLELPSDVNRLRDPAAYLTMNAHRLVCLDEVQRLPELFPTLRAHVDRDRRAGRLLLLGSASPHFLRQSSESLAGRIGYHDLTPFSLDEAGPEHLRTHWLRGGFPESFLAFDDISSFRWRRQFIRTYLEADIPALGIGLSRPAMERLWTMPAGASGKPPNKATLADPAGVSPQTIGCSIDVLESTSMVGVLRPLSVNVKKRLVKSPRSTSGTAESSMRCWTSGARTISLRTLSSDPPGNPTRWSSSARRSRTGARRSIGPREVPSSIWSWSAEPRASPDAYPVDRETVVCTPDRLAAILRDER